MRPAFTVVELLVAIAVLTVGVLALAATAGMVASHVGDGGQLTGAAHSARSIIDSLGAQDCAAVTSGSTTRGRTDLQWTVTRDSAGARIQLIARTAVRRDARRDAYDVLVPCVRE